MGAVDSRRVLASGVIAVSWILKSFPTDRQHPQLAFLAFNFVRTRYSNLISGRRSEVGVITLADFFVLI